jgi:hypothetical protein
MATILLANELVARAAEFASQDVRVVGQLKRFDARTQRAIAELKGVELTINTELLARCSFWTGFCTR